MTFYILLKNFYFLLEKEPKKQHLMTLLDPIRHKWEIIGVQLGVCHGHIQSVQQNIDTCKLSEVLQMWIDERNSDVCWGTIISVVEEPPINNKNVADQIYEFLSRPNIQRVYLPSHEPGKIKTMIFNDCFYLTL